MTGRRDLVPTDTGLAASLLASNATGWRLLSRRIAAALALGWIYGAAIGARYGVDSMIVHGLGVAAGMLAVVLFAAPSFFILMAHAGHRANLQGMLDAVSSAVATTGLVLCGLAPAAALLTVSTEGGVAAALFAALGLVVAGVLGLRALHGALGASSGGAATRLVGAGFLGFAGLLAARVWWLALPMLGRGHF